jgi:UDP-glucuronate decarboxylase
MKILVTGASGIIGLKLVEYLAKHTDAVIDAAYFSTRHQLNQISLQFPGRVNVSHYHRILEQSHSNIYDEIWHFATYGQPARFIDSWQQVVDLNSQHIILLSKLLRSGGKFHFASTSEIYSSSNLATEDSIPGSKPSGPRSIYTESKRLGEAICTTLFPRECHLIYRICLTYSEDFRPDDRRVMYELVMKGVMDNSISLLDKGAAKRQYIYVDDAVRMMVDLSVDKRRLMYPDSVFNIANHDQITILELASKLASIIGCNVYPGKAENPLGALDSVEILPKRYLELNPDFSFTSLSDGLKRVVDNAKIISQQIKEI